MLKEECQTSIKQIKEIAIQPHVVDKIAFLLATEPCHAKQELRIILRAFGEQCRCGILDFTVFHHRKLVEQCHRVFRGRRCRHPSFGNAIHDGIADLFLVQIFHTKRVGGLAFPCEAFGVAAAQSFLKHGTRHEHCGAFHLVVGATIVGVWGIAKLGGLGMDSYHITLRAVWHLDDFQRQFDGWFYLGDFVGDFSLCVVGDVLSQNL